MADLYRYDIDAFDEIVIRGPNNQALGTLILFEKNGDLFSHAENLVRHLNTPQCHGGQYTAVALDYGYGAAHASTTDTDSAETLGRVCTGTGVTLAGVARWSDALAIVDHLNREFLPR